MSGSTQPMQDNTPKSDLGEVKANVCSWLIQQSEGLASVLLKNRTVCAGRDCDTCDIVFKSETFVGKGDDIAIDKV